MKRLPSAIPLVGLCLLFSSASLPAVEPALSDALDCDITIQGHHGGSKGRIQVRLHSSEVRNNVGWWGDIGTNGYNIVFLDPGQRFSEVVRQDFGCNARRKWRFPLRATVDERDYDFVYYYPSDDGFTRETVIDLGDVSRFFDAIEPGPPITSPPTSTEPPASPLSGLNLGGEWVRRESNNNPNDGMLITVSGDRAVLTYVPPTASRNWHEGEVLWQNIRPDGTLEVLGSNDAYYDAEMIAEGVNVVHIDINANGRGNDQSWERAQQSIDGDSDEGSVFEDVQIAEACADQLQLDPAVAALIDPIVDEEITEQELVGLAVGIIRNGQIVHLKGYGYADRENDVPVTTETLFRWASISKTVTAVAAVQMWEDGELDLDADVGNLVPEFREVPSRVITMRQLLANTAGVEAYPDGWRARARSYPNTSAYDPIAALPILNDTLLFTPGSQWNYSTMNFMLAGAAMERIARSRYGYPTGDFSSGYVQFVHERIAEPLCMETLAVDYPRETSHLDAKRYGKDLNNVLFPYAGDRDEIIHWRLPGGGFESRIVDLALFANSLLRQSLLTAEGDSTLTAETPMSATREPSYALGLYLGDADTPNRLGHGGVQRGVRNHMYLYPAADLAILFLSNNSHTNRERIQRRLLAALAPSTWPERQYNLTSHIDCDTDQQNSDSRFAGVWQDGPTDQLLRRGYTQRLFARERERLRAQGYHLTDLEAFVEDGERLWDGVFTRGVPPTRLWRDFTPEAFVAKIAEQRALGYELADVEVYSRRPGVGAWAGVFEPADEDRTLIQDRNIAEFRNVWDRLADLGHRLVDVEKYEGPNGERWFAGLFVRGSGGHDMDLDVAPEDFDALRNDFAREGLRIIDVERYTSGTNPPQWAVVAGPIDGNQTSRIDKPFCGTWNGPFTGFWETHEDLARQGRALLDFERYPMN
ncbi:MAG: serine hydrolase domain-containing protein [Bacteroidota bacterium]